MSKRKGKKNYTDEQKQWIINTVKNKKTNNAELTKLFNKRFNQDRSERGIASIRRKLGVNTQQTYKKEHIEFLKKKAKIKGMTNKKITKLFNKHFKDNRSENSIRYIRSKNNIPLNSRQAIYMLGRNHRGSRPIGAERVRKGYVEIKVGQPNEWEQKHRHIWEKHNRPLKSDEVVIFLDNNNRNFNIDNLKAVKRKYIAQMNYEGFMTENKELTKAGLNVVKLKCKTNKLEKEKI